GFEINEFLCDCSHAIEVARGPAIVGTKVASLHPAQFLKALPKGGKPSATFRIGVGITPTHHGDKQPHAVALLRARDVWPRGCRAAERGQEFSASDVACHVTPPVGGHSCNGGMIPRLYRAVCD